MSIDSLCKTVLLHWNLEWESYNIYIIRNTVGTPSFFTHLLSSTENWSDTANRNCSDAMEHPSHKAFT